MSEKITELMLEKYINEEIMTKSELDRRLDVVLNKYTQHVDAKFDVLENKINAKFETIDHRFEQVDKRFTQMDIKYNWLIGMIVTATIGIIGIVIKLH
jgi:tetrahydromethanopterin S-methyltransferase subunit G